MANPAEDLYQIFREWRSGKTNEFTYNIRNLQSEAFDEGWITQRHASACLSAISHIFDRMEEHGDDVSAERVYFKDWTHAVFSYPEGWSKSGSRVSDQAFNTLGMFRNSCKRFLPEIDSGILEEIMQLIADEPSMTPPPGSYPVELYDYFTRVREHLKYCVENLTGASVFDLQAAAEHYRAAVFMMANGSFVTNPGDWGRYATQWFGIKLARKFGSKVYDEAFNELAKGTVRSLTNGARLMLEAGSGTS